MSELKSLSKGRYKQMVRDNAVEIAIGQGKRFTVNEFCKQTGFKDTPNLRRRLTELVYDGTLGWFQAYTETGSLAGFYGAPMLELVGVQKALPF